MEAEINLHSPQSILPYHVPGGHAEALWNYQ